MQKDFIKNLKLSKNKLNLIDKKKKYKLKALNSKTSYNH